MSSFNQRGCFGCGGPLDGLLCRRCTCELCGNNLRNGFCLICDPGAGNSFAYDPNPNSFNDPPNFFNHPAQPQTYSCELCGNDSHYGYDCPPRVPLYSIDHQEDLNQQKISDVHDRWDKLEESHNELLNVVQSFYEMESTIPLNEIDSQIPPSIAITPVLPTLELEDSLIMGDEELNTIPEKESDEFIKSSVEDLVPIPSESEDTSESDSVLGLKDFKMILRVTTAQVTDIAQKDKNKVKWTKPSMGMKEYEKSKPKAYTSLMGQPVKISAGFAIKKDRKNLSRKSNKKSKIFVSVPDDRYAVSNGSGYAVLISLNEYAVLDKKLDSPYSMEVDTPYSTIDQNSVLRKTIK
ncbi:hypothetical protein Tco_0027455 [Tanacetum coccineum]